MNTIQSQIYSNGKLVSTNIVSIDVMKTVNKIPYAQVVITGGGDDEKSPVEISNEACFKPGGTLEISLEHGEKKGIFKGVVIKHNLHRNSERTLLTIDIKDSSVKLCQARRSAVYTRVDDIQVIRDIAGKSGLSVSCKEKTYRHKQLVQYYCTDWDFIVSRAEANGLVVCVENGELSVVRPDIEVASKEIAGIYEFEMEANMDAQFKKTVSVCWDIKNAACGEFENSVSPSFKNSHNINELSKTMGTDKQVIVSGVYGEKEEMEAWANASMMRDRFSMLRGRVSAGGNPELKPGDTIKISGAGDIFDCTTMVSAVRHRITRDGWTTDIQCGMSDHWFHKGDDIIETPAAGLLPGVNGLQTGVVEAYPRDGDPEKFHRIRVRIPAVDESESVIWARLASFCAGNQRGMLWVPEEGDEVVVGFFNDDPRHAVVIGSLYNGKAKPPLKMTKDNNEKGIVTRSGTRVVLSDKEGEESVVIRTPKGNVVVLQDKTGLTVKDEHKNQLTFRDNEIMLRDQNGNSVSLNNIGIELKSNDNTNIVRLHENGITIDSKAEVEIYGSSIKMDSDGEMAIKGSSITMN